MMKLSFRLAAAMAAILLRPVAVSAQTSVPLRTLSAPIATSAHTFGAVESVRALRNGNAIVNDSRTRQLVIVDSSLSLVRVALDSTVANESAPSYSGQISLIQYISDSMLYRDARLRKFVVIDPNGAVAHTFERTITGFEMLFMFPPRGFDAAGNAIQTGIPDMRMSMAKGAGKSTWHIKRVNFDKQQYEELASIESDAVGGVRSALDARGNPHTVHTVNPLAAGDDWTVMHDGTLAVLRSKDYHVEFIGTDGRKRVSAKLPLQKRKVTDDEKRALIDSARTALMTGASLESARSNLIDGLAQMGADSIRRIPRDENGKLRITVSKDGAGPEPEFGPLREMAGEYPPFRRGGAVSDADGNLWIATYAISPSGARETIYDIVNGDAMLTHRVRVPDTHAIVGFARGGIVYLKSRRAPNEWVIERVRVVD